MSREGKPSQYQPLKEIARNLRCQIIKMLEKSGSGHTGGSLSAVEIVTALYFHHMRHRPDDPCWTERDRFILSKGHGAPLLYATMAECGYFPKDALFTLRTFPSLLQGHPDRTCTPGVEASTGSLGQGLSFGVGVALAGKRDGKDYHVYVVLGDGECDEGQVWEAAMAAAHFELDHLVAIVDYNKQQIDGWNKDVMKLEPFADKWRSFGWHVMEAQGHDFDDLIKALDSASHVKRKPTLIIAHTTKGKGVSFMENNPEFHGRAPTADEAKRALAELSRNIDD